MIYMGSLSAKRHNSPASPVHSKVTTLVQEQWKERHHPSAGLMALSGPPHRRRIMKKEGRMETARKKVHWEN
jgi:hypothetical protein